MKEKNKRVLVTIKCILVTLFIVIVVFGMSGSFLYNLWDSIISLSGYGAEISVRIILSLIVLIVILLAKNQYIFTQKREGFFKSFKYLFPYIVLPTLLLLLSIVGVETNNLTIIKVIGFILMYIMVGIFEEFLCRGWALNELLEVFNNDRKGVLTSIGISSIIFGLLHSVNFFGADPSLVIVQIISATIFGFYIGSLYYRSKNIWVCVFVHAYWDISLSILSELLIPEYCSTAVEMGTFSVPIVLLSFIIVTLPIAFYNILCTSLLVGKKDLNPLLDEQVNLPLKYEKNNKKYKIFAITGVLLLALMISLSYYGGNMVDNESCPKYIEMIPSSYKEEIYHISSYSINYFDTSGNINNYSIDLVDNEIIIKNINTNESFRIEDALEVIVIETNNNYVIIYLDNDGRTFMSNKLNPKDVYNSVFMKKFEESFESIKIPNSSLLGKYIDVTSKKEYPLIIDTIGDRYLIDETMIYKYKE